MHLSRSSNSSASGESPVALAGESVAMMLKLYQERDRLDEEMFQREEEELFDSLELLRARFQRHRLSVQRLEKAEAERVQRESECVALVAMGGPAVVSATADPEAIFVPEKMGACFDRLDESADCVQPRRKARRLGSAADKALVKQASEMLPLPPRVSMLSSTVNINMQHSDTEALKSTKSSEVQCPVCLRMIKNMSAFVQHKRTHDRANELAAVEDAAIASSSSKSSPAKSLACELCGLQFHRPYLLRRHLLRFHPDVPDTDADAVNDTDTALSESSRVTAPAAPSGASDDTADARRSTSRY